jgi:hypothetical protein
LLDVSDEVLWSFRIMMIELHSLDRIFSRFALKMIVATFQKLLGNHHIVHLRPNNFICATVGGDIAIQIVMEFTCCRMDGAMLEPCRKL